ncbi:MAG: roadblock/LC7 domain-containing protein [Nitrospirae bacterium]|nr:roadblock/LC7 domain-containing protein [Candidatus Troglogloeales bacterium]
MSDPGWVLHDGDFKLIEAELTKLADLANAKLTFLVDKDGHLIASAGDSRSIDTTSLASLTAGNIAASGGIAKLLGEKEFTFLFHEGERDHIHLSTIAQRVILVVIFDQRSSLGLVRLRVRKSGEALTKIFSAILSNSEKDRQEQETRSPFAAITEADIDRLFG